MVKNRPVYCRIGSLFESNFSKGKNVPKDPQKITKNGFFEELAFGWLGVTKPPYHGKM